MNKFNKPNRFGGGNRGGDRKSFGGGRNGGGFNSNRGGRGFGGPREMHDTVCAGCGDNCQVPFRPTGDKPVYCDNCFGKNEQKGGRNDRGGKKDFGNKNSNYKPMVDGQNDNLKKQIETLNTKIDALTNLVQSMVVAKPVAKESASKAEKKPVAKATKKVVAKKAVKTVAKKTATKKTSKSKK